MTETNNNSHANMVFEELCNILDSENLPYEKDEEQKIIHINICGEDLDIPILIYINEELQLVILQSYLPFCIPEDKMAEIAIATCSISSTLPVGNFIYDINQQNIVFVFPQSCINRTLGKDLFLNMIDVAINFIDKYNDKLFMISKGQMSLDELLEEIQSAQ